MRLTSLELINFRNYEHIQLELAPTTTVVIGGNGVGKTNLVEAIAWLASGSSFRGAPDDALVRLGEDDAIVRAEGRRGQRDLQIEAQITRSGRNRVLVNRQRLQRVADLADAFQVTVFAPDDLALVKGGPTNRRRLLDDALAALHPRNRSVQQEVDRVLRQRNTLLRQAGGRRSDDIDATLDVWDHKLATAGTALIDARENLVERLLPPVGHAYDTLAGSASQVRMTYEGSRGDQDLATALSERRDNDIRRATTTVGPHRDELTIRVDEMPARTHCSQGEQRTLALALRLGTHQLLIDELDATPLLVLDDVFSELDECRATALLGEIPVGQVLMTTASPLPSGASPERILSIPDLIDAGDRDE